MEPATYNIPPHTSGDSWKGIPSLKITINGVPPSVSLASVKMQFRKSCQGSVALELSSSNGKITIVDAIGWEMSIPKQVVSMPPETYLYDLQTVDSNGDIVTYLKGEWPILADITK